MLIGGTVASWPRYSLNEQVGQPDATTTEHYQEQRGPSEGYWWPEFAARDTYAQWAMAILALAAVAISIIGVLLIRRTFEETKRTADAAVEGNETARQIGQAQVRAYLHVASCDFTVAERNFVFLNLHIANAGQSPAPQCVVSACLVAPRVFEDRIEAGLERSSLVVAEVFAISTTTPGRTFLMFHSPLNDLAMKYMHANQMLVSAEIQVRWVDVFGDWQVADFTAIEVHQDVARFNVDSPKSRIGEMKIYTSKPR